MLSSLLIACGLSSVASLSNVNFQDVKLAYLDHDGFHSIVASGSESDIEHQNESSEAVTFQNRTASAGPGTPLNQSIKGEILGADSKHRPEASVSGAKLNMTFDSSNMTIVLKHQHLHSTSTSDDIPAVHVSGTNASAVSRETLNSTHQAPKVDVQNLMNRSLAYEVNMTSSSTQISKIGLAVVNLLFLGICGVDRCMAGQVCLGVIKGLTLGALGVWSLLDYVTIVINCLGKYETLTWMGYDVTFSDEDTQPAFVLTLVCVILKLCMSLGCLHRVRLVVSGPTNEEK